MPELKAARAIVQRLRKRQLYQMADELIVPAPLFAHWKIVHNPHGFERSVLIRSVADCGGAGDVPEP